MSKDEYENLAPIQCNGDDLIVIDESNSISDYAVRPARPAVRKRAEEYLADLKKYRPQEYEELIKRRQAGT